MSSKIPINKQVLTLTTLVKSNFKKTVESLIEIGRCLHLIRKLLSREKYIAHIKKEFSMSEVHAARLESLYIHFHSKQSINVLSSKPSVLYLLASLADEKKIEILTRGGRVKVGSKKKTIDQLTIADANLLIKMSKKAVDPFDVDDKDLDEQKAKMAHRRLGTLIEELDDWALDLNRFHSKGLKIENANLVKNYISETILSLEKIRDCL